ncbi:MAG: type IV toxin-antitoxin system AbiEi family antitoxin [Planctomycetes bacterium]|nr:type IV toxin-antitoxin system AbiEi family antitoxin [Planctomycetota bacterium]
MDVNDPQAPSRIPAYLDRLQGVGRYTFSLAEARQAGARSEASLAASLARLKAQNRLASPRRGFYVIVPVEYRSAGAPPAAWFVDDLMAHLGHAYYVGLLTAAAYHGAAHQQPQVFQVVTAEPVRPIATGRQRLEFTRNRKLARVPVVSRKTDTGHFVLASAEATAFDLVRHPEACGHLDHVATVLTELAEVLDPAELVRAAEAASQADARRLGYLLEQLGFGELVAPLAEHVTSLRRRRVLLAPKQPAGDRPPDPVWAVVPNHELQPDL